MSNKINSVAIGIHIFVKRDESASERNGLTLPDSAIKKPNIGEILSIGKGVKDKGVMIGRKAIWNQHVGFDMEVDGEIFTVLTEHEILGAI